MNLIVTIVGTVTIYLTCLVVGYTWAKIVGGDDE